MSGVGFVGFLAIDTAESGPVGGVWVFMWWARRPRCLRLRLRIGGLMGLAHRERLRGWG